MGLTGRCANSNCLLKCTLPMLSLPPWLHCKARGRHGHASSFRLPVCLRPENKFVSREVPRQRRVFPFPRLHGSLATQAEAYIHAVPLLRMCVWFLAPGLPLWFKPPSKGPLPFETFRMRNLLPHPKLHDPTWLLPSQVPLLEGALASLVLPWWAGAICLGLLSPLHPAATSHQPPCGKLEPHLLVHTRG